MEAEPSWPCLFWGSTPFSRQAWGEMKRDTATPKNQGASQTTWHRCVMSMLLDLRSFGFSWFVINDTRSNDKPYNKFINWEKNDEWLKYKHRVVLTVRVFRQVSKDISGWPRGCWGWHLRWTLQDTNIHRWSSTFNIVLPFRGWGTCPHGHTWATTC